MSWSPDQEVVVFATGLNKLILMNKEFDPIMETALHTIEVGEGTSNVTINSHCMQQNVANAACCQLRQYFYPFPIMQI